MTGEQLKILRVIYGYKTQKKLANRLNVHASTIQRWENTKLLNIETVSKLLSLNWNPIKCYLFIEQIRKAAIKL